MQEIIKINQNEQGEAQVSARELYQHWKLRNASVHGLKQTPSN